MKFYIWHSPTPGLTSNSLSVEHILYSMKAPEASVCNDVPFIGKWSLLEKYFENCPDRQGTR